MSNRSNAIILATALGFGAAGFGASRMMARPPQPAPAPSVTSAAIGDAAPVIELAALDGPPRALDAAEWSGRLRLVNFWATWCAPCVHEMPLLDAYDAAREDLIVIGIALDQADPVRAFVANVGIRYPILLDTPGPADSSVRLGNARGVLPYSVLLDADGRLVATRVGDFEDRDALDAWIAAASP